MKSLFKILIFTTISILIHAQGSGSCIYNQSWVDCGTNTILGFTSSFSVEAWVYPLNDGSNNDLTGTHFIIDRRSTYGGYDVRLENGSVRFTVKGNDGSEHHISTSISDIVANKWQHIACVLDVTSGKTLIIYINGVGKASSNTGSYTMDSETSEFLIGKSKYVNPYYLYGRIDEVRAWSKTLSYNEIRASMCKKLTGSESSLEGYWRLDEGSGSVATDDSPNENTGTVHALWKTSGAPIGDASIYNYSSPANVTLAHSDGDYASISTITGSPYGVQIYRVDEAPNVTTAPGNLTNLFTTRYWGVFIVEGTSPTYSFTYYYNGNPDVGSYENYQDLATRANNGSTSWTEANAILNTTTKTLTLTGQTGTEYIDGREVNPTPVELTSFGGINTEDGVVLSWQTATEVNNYGFEVERSEDNLLWQIIGFVHGKGTTNSPKSYSFTDPLNLTHNPNLNRIDYRLKQIDNDGTFAYSKTITVDLTTITDVDDEVNYKFALEQNYPNPFNPSTKIKFTVPSDVRHETKEVRLVVYDILGREVTTLVNQKLQPGNHEVQFNASRLSSGMYFYMIEIGSEFTSVKKMLLMK